MDARESFALLVCGATVIMLMLSIPYIFNWWRRK